MAAWNGLVRVYKENKMEHLWDHLKRTVDKKYPGVTHLKNFQSYRLTKSRY